MIRANYLSCFFFAGIFALSGCITGSEQNTAGVIMAVDVDEIESIPAAHEFARLCLARNKQISSLIEFAKTDGWREGDDEFLNAIGLGDLRRKILSIPGGGGRYHETQSILIYDSKTEIMTANLMERFRRDNKLVRTECTLFVKSPDYLQICTAIGKLLKRPPDSNQRFKRTGSHFIRWNISMENNPASVRCEGLGVVESTGNPTDKMTNGFSGTVISMIVNQLIEGDAPQANSNRHVSIENDR